MMSSHLDWWPHFNLIGRTRSTIRTGHEVSCYSVFNRSGYPSVTENLLRDKYLGGNVSVYEAGLNGSESYKEHESPQGCSRAVMETV